MRRSASESSVPPPVRVADAKNLGLTVTLRAETPEELKVLLAQIDIQNAAPKVKAEMAEKSRVDLRRVART